MTSPLSVLLIVGGAAIGPIDAQPTVDVFHLPGGYSLSGLNMRAMNGGRLFEKTFPQEYVARVENCKARTDKDTFQCMALVDDGADGIPLETLPQLCERAMREIGAFQGSQRKYQGSAWRVIEGWFLPGVANFEVEVRCIPTPTGYRK